MECPDSFLHPDYLVITTTTNSPGLDLSAAVKAPVKMMLGFVKLGAERTGDIRYKSSPQTTLRLSQSKERSFVRTPH